MSTRLVFFILWALVQLGRVSSIGEVAEPKLTSNVTLISEPIFSPEEEEHIVSLTVRLYCSTPGVAIYYTLDGTQPGLASLSAASGESILIDSIGVTEVRAFSYLSITTDTNSSTEGSIKSAVVSKKYTLVDRCLPPVILPGGGTFAGRVNVDVASPTAGSRVIYTLDNTTPREGAKSTFFLPLGTDTLQLTSSSTLSVVAVKTHLAPSAVTRHTFTILPKVASPIIEPQQTTFAVSATLTITCSTPNAVIYYTTDGTQPTESSYYLDPLSSQVVLDQTGSTVITAFATLGNMLQSDPVIKHITILPRAASPLLNPPPGTFVNEVSVCFSCPSALSSPHSVPTSPLSNSSSGVVYYTLDGRSTPSERSAHLSCGSCLLLADPSVVHVRAFVTEPNKSPSSITSAQFTIVRPAYDVHPVNPNATLQLRPDVNIYVVEKNLPHATSGFCGKRNVRGRLVVLHNPVGHFDVVEPEHGCGGGLSLPSASGRRSWARAASHVASTTDVNDGNSFFPVDVDAAPAAAAPPPGGGDDVTALPDAAAGRVPQHDLPPYSSFYSPSQLDALSQEDISLWEEDYLRADAHGCEVVTNAGFFNVSSGHCLGDLVSAGEIVQTSEKHNVNFGIRGGQFVTGYVTRKEIAAGVSGAAAGDNGDLHVPFDTLVSGLGWLVRGGEVYVEESFHGRHPPAHPSAEDADSPLYSSLYGEDMSAQSSGDSFSTLLSARTALGHDAQGRLLLLQVEGESWVRGMSLQEFASFAVELGFYSAINLDGGGSATMAVNHSLVSEPSWQCTAEDYNGGGASHSLPLERTYCEKRVSSVTCIHSMPPPSMRAQKTTEDSKDSKEKEDQGESPLHSKSPSPSVPDTTSSSPSGVPVRNTSGSYAEEIQPERVRSLEAQLRASRSSDALFKYLSAALGLMLVISLAAHFILCWRHLDKVPTPPLPTQDAAFQWHSHSDMERRDTDNSSNSIHHGRDNRNVELASSGLSPNSRHSYRRDLRSGPDTHIPDSRCAVGDIEEGRSQGRGHSEKTTRSGLVNSDFSNDQGGGNDDDDALENYGLPDSLDFDEFSDSGDDGDDGSAANFRVRSDMAYVNQPVARAEHRTGSVSLSAADEDEDLEEEEVDIELEERASLLSREPPADPEHTQKKKKKSKEKKSKASKKNKQMSMNFSDRTL